MITGSKTRAKGQNIKIFVVGIGYVGLSNAALLAQHNTVVAVDISEARVAQVNNRQCPIFGEQLTQSRLMYSMSASVGSCRLMAVFFGGAGSEPSLPLKSL